jgi:hypothetical protein
MKMMNIMETFNQDILVSTDNQNIKSTFNIIKLMKKILEIYMDY